MKRVTIQGVRYNVIREVPIESWKDRWPLVYSSSKNEGLIADYFLKRPGCKRLYRQRKYKDGWAPYKPWVTTVREMNQY